MALTNGQKKILTNMAGYFGLITNKLQVLANDPDTTGPMVRDECHRIMKMMNTMYEKYTWIKPTTFHTDQELKDMKIN